MTSKKLTRAEKKELTLKLELRDKKELKHLNNALLITNKIRQAGGQPLLSLDNFIYNSVIVQVNEAYKFFEEHMSPKTEETEVPVNE